MSQVLFSKVLIDHSELNKLKEYEKQIKEIHAERKKDLQIVPSSKESSSVESLESDLEGKNKAPLNENNIEQSGSGVIETPKYNETILCEQLIHKISEAVIQQLRYLNY